MKRRLFLFGLAASSAIVAAAAPAFAASYAEDVIAQLTKLGFSGITVETTWLGRIKIVASRSDGVREIVLNPNTGEILRDVWMPVSGGGLIRHVLDDVEDEDSGGSDDGGGDDNSGSGGGDDGGGDDSSGSGSGDDDGMDQEDREDGKGG